IWMYAARVRPTLRVLPDGKVQVIGGDQQGTIEMYHSRGRFFRGHAALLPTVDSFPVDELLTARTRAALIGLVGHSQGAFRFGADDASPSARAVTTQVEKFADLLNRTEYACAELPHRQQAVIAGGARLGGDLVSSVFLVKSSPAFVTTDQID